MPTETFEFQVEARQLLQMMIHSIYSNKDVFLRELISNASDALDKVRIESLRDDALEVDVSDLHIEIEADQDSRTLIVRDNGIGMSHDEVVELIGTIAKSGTAELLKKLREAQDTSAAEGLIGQFGVGFYASFMVAEEVQLLTRRAGESQGTRWSSAGEGTYTIESVDEAPQGTSVILRLKPADDDDQLFDYTSTWKIREIVKRYSDFITWPIRLAAPAVAEAEPAESADEDAADGDAAVEGAADGDAADGDAADGEKKASAPAEPETLNSMKALWARSRGEVADEEYHELYKHISHDWNNPLETIHLRAEGTFEYQSLLFLPKRASQDLYSQAHKRGVQLYVKRVFIMDDCEALIPEYLRFVKGVVDAQDLSLNVSREILQQDRQIQLMRRRLVKKVLSTLREMMAGREENYTAFWKEFGRVVKEGLLSDSDNRDAILAVCSFDSTQDEEKQTTLKQYVERMKDGQQHIYYMTGESRTAVENSPHMEAFRDKGLEVLVLTDPVDEVWVDAVPEFEGRQLRSVAKGDADLETEEQSEETKAERERQQEDYAELLRWMSERLSEEVREVRLSSRLTVSPACVVSDAEDVTPALQNIYRAMGQEVPIGKRVLELNPSHGLVTGLRKAHAADTADPALGSTTELLYGMALLAEGSQLADPARFTKLLAERLEQSL
ncbi:molecular chaperone HtpG [Streptomyces profundus]|uniref:molecular chaperone HtpG n=1 Tax=Streptomyces profundus TaxID=2867410 RepID=UPI001D15FBA5|nr:molecular chaperone HtpG [Streptomyces sp. MA3_2.13]UED83900.1 molecular chaperone HtpG [Streptomyces sp. MA3_2.13]